MRMVLALLTSLRSFSSFWHGIARKRSLLVLRASVDIKSTEKSATMSRVFCTFFPQKGTQKSPADACAYSVPSNVRNGRLFAGLQANRPRFLPLLAGPSFHSFGIGPGSFAAKRGGKDASGTSRKHRSLRSPPRGGAEANETAAKDPQVAGLQTTRAAQTPPLKRTLPRAGANEKTKRTRRRRTAKIFATKRQRYLAGEDRGMFHVLSVTKAQTKRPAKRRPFFRRMPDKSL